MVLRPEDVMFRFPLYSEYREAIVMAEEPIFSVGAAYNVLRFRCPIESIYSLARTRQIRSWGVVEGDGVAQYGVSILDVVAHGLRLGWLHEYADLGIKGLVSEAQFSGLSEAVKAGHFGPVVVQTLAEEGNANPKG